MALFPLFVDLNGLSCLVVGAGAVASRRVKSLLDFGPRITVCAPEVSPELQALAAQGLVELLLRPFADSDLAGRDLVIAATNRPELNHRIAQLGAAQGSLVNDANTSTPIRGAFAFPAIVRRDQVVVGIGSSGSDPGLSKQVRQAIELVLAERPEQRTGNPS
jgi:siroheme synthase-like protein